MYFGESTLITALPPGLRGIPLQPLKLKFARIYVTDSLGGVRVNVSFSPNPVSFNAIWRCDSDEILLDEFHEFLNAPKPSLQLVICV